MWFYSSKNVKAQKFSFEVTTSGRIQCQTFMRVYIAHKMKFSIKKFIIKCN